MGDHLAGAAHDASRPWEGAPARSYLLCSMPRSGSTLLTRLLHETGRMGTPIEYFDRTDVYRVLRERWGCPTVECYIACLHRHRTTSDGLFGAKVHWFQLRELEELLFGEDRLRATHGHACEHAVVERVFPSCRFVHVTRGDRDRQAVSWAIAAQTEMWRLVPGEGPPPVEPEYRFREIEARRRLLDASDQHWDAFLAEVGAGVLRITYEDLVADREGVVRAVAAHVGADLDGVVVPPPHLRRQADDRNEAFLERYLADRARGFYR